MTIWASGKNQNSGDGGGGTLIDSVYAERNDVVVSSNPVPYPAQPTQSGGVLVLTAPPITPISASSKLHVSGNVYVTGTVAAAVVASIFRDAEGAPIVSMGSVIFGSTTRVTIPIFREILAGGTSAMVFKLYIGVNLGTITLNGIGGVLEWGGALKAVLSVKEIK